jgi:alpha-glucosidase
MQQAKVAAMLLLTLRGTPTIYYGEEIGMTDVPIPVDEVRDPQGLNMPGKNLSRDPERTPMQWDGSDNGGFSSAKPWLRLSSEYKRRNVEKQKGDPYSMLCFYKQLLELRQREASFIRGDYKPVHADKQSLAYIRTATGEKAFLVVLNLSHRPCYLNLEHITIDGEVVLSTSPELKGTKIGQRMQLSGDEGIIVELLNRS